MKQSTSISASLATALADKLGAGRVATAPHEVATAARDMGVPPTAMARAFIGPPPALVVRPQSPEELATAVTYLRAAHVPFTPRGLGSAGLGGAVPVDGGAVLDLSRLVGVLSIDRENHTASVRAGTTFFAIEQALAPIGLRLQARPSNAFGTVGGWVVGGGLGLGSLGAGTAVEHVREIEFVTPAGYIERLTQTEGGFADHFGAEGQLGVLSEITLQVDTASRSTVVGAAFPSMAEAMAAVNEVCDLSQRPRTITLLDGDMTRHSQGGDGSVVLLAELNADQAVPGALSGPKTLSRREAAHLWNHRFFPMDGHLGPIFLAGEVIIPADKADAFLAASRRLAGRYRAPLEAHIHAFIDGSQPSLLILLMYPTDPRDQVRHTVLSSLAAALTSLGIRHGGRPYGVGLWNTPFARARFGRQEFERLTELKRQHDPGHLLNPGKMFELKARSALMGAVMKPGILPLALSAVSLVAPLALKRKPPRLPEASTADRCISCAACVPVCPAVAVTGDEGVSGRAKLDLLRRLTAGAEVSEAELLDSQRCVMCGQCSEVCARGLDLVAAWEDLEVEVKKRVNAAAWTDTVTTFADDVDQQRQRAIAVGLG